MRIELVLSLKLAEIFKLWSHMPGNHCMVLSKDCAFLEVLWLFLWYHEVYTTLKENS